MAEAENGKRQVHARMLPSQGSGPVASVKLDTGGALAGTLKSTTTTQGVAGPSRQPTPLAQRWPSDALSTPRRVVSEPATPPKESATPSRTNSATRITQVSPATRGPSQLVMGPIITPVRQVPNASGPTSSGGGQRKPSYVPVLIHTFVN